MSDLPPRLPLTDAEKDDVLQEIAPILRELRVALANYNLQSHEVERLGGVVANHEGRLATVESQIVAGVHYVPADPEIPVTVEEPRIGHLSPPPRPPMSTHESLDALRVETAKQTPLLRKTADTNEKLVESNKQVVESNRVASARYLGTFVAALLLALSQNCSATSFFHHPPPAPPSQVTAPSSPK